jgi:hypothetical protein
MGQVFPLRWNHLPIVAGISGSLGLTLARAGVWCHSSGWYADGGRRRVHSIPYSHEHRAPGVCRPLAFLLDN